MGLFAELLASPGVREESELRSTFGFMAFHGGNLEVATDVIAREAASRSGSSYYGVVQPLDFRWHIPSIAVTPTESPVLAEFIAHVDVVVAIHGYGRDGFWTSLLVGGTHRPLAAEMANALRVSHPEYSHLDSLDDIPNELRGQHALNPCNLPRGGGVQLELPPRIRGNTPHWSDWAGPGHPPPMEALINTLAIVAQQWTGDDSSP